MASPGFFVPSLMRGPTPIYQHMTQGRQAKAVDERLRKKGTRRGHASLRSLTTRPSVDMQECLGQVVSCNLGDANQGAR